MASDFGGVLTDNSRYYITATRDVRQVRFYNIYKYFYTARSHFWRPTLLVVFAVVEKSYFLLLETTRRVSGNLGSGAAAGQGHPVGAPKIKNPHNTSLCTL